MLAKYQDKYKAKNKERVTCPVCQKNVSRGGLEDHKKTLKCRGLPRKGNYKTSVHKTAGRKSVTSPTAVKVAAVPAVSSKSNSLTEINLKQEYDKMVEILNPKKKSGKEKKYQCGSCGATFDNLNDGKCPDCQEQMQ